MIFMDKGAAFGTMTKKQKNTPAILVQLSNCQNGGAGL